MLLSSAKIFIETQRWNRWGFSLLIGTLLLASSAMAEIWYLDNDGDGYGRSDMWVDEPSSPGPEWTLLDGDCDDNDDSIYQGAPELCDGKDNDCDSIVDNDCWPLWYQDADSDGFGNDDVTVYAESQPVGYVAQGGDCMDSVFEVNPNAPEICDGLDNNCDSQTDEGLSQDWYRDDDGDGFGNPLITTFDCQQSLGWVLDDTDCDDNNDVVYPGAPEIYDGHDNNCNGQVDEGWSLWYVDFDGDGWGTGTALGDTVQPVGYVDQEGDCDDDNPYRYPFAPEICNGVDDDCDGFFDEDCVMQWFRDVDGDGWGDYNDRVVAEDPPAGYVPEFGDCDDNEPTVYPTACEICDGLDNDCNELIDDNCGSIWYRDIDGDGYGDPSNTACGITQPAGYLDVAGDCNDYAEFTYPDAPEICDGQDNNCDGQIDEGVQAVWYQDLDGDSYGTHADSVWSCDYVEGYAEFDGDCDDSNPDIYPDRMELCNGIDDNCNMVVDEAPVEEGEFFLYRDEDGDGYGLHEWFFCTEQDPIPAGFSELNGDCMDNDPAINPGVDEICDGIDNNCDGQIDEGIGIWWYPDADQDGYGSSNLNYNQILCPGEVPAEYPEYFATNDLDCNDLDPNIHPGVLDLNDWIDNDCDGLVDEDAGTTALVSLADVGNDNGRYLRVRWTRHLMDQPGAPESVTLYSLYRRIDAWKSQNDENPVEVLENAPAGDWDWVATVPAVGDSMYSLVAHTLCDSTDAGICWSVFFVRSHTPEPFVFYDSPVDSGYSVDNLFPTAPQNLAVAYTADDVTLQWAPTSVSDFRCYRIYRGEGEFLPDETNIIQQTTQPGWTDLVSDAYDLSYLVTTVDQAGNESPAASPVAVSGVDNIAVPKVWGLGAPVPNPFNPMTTLKFDVPECGGQVSLRIYDLAGRVVKTLLQEFRPAGSHQIVWQGDGNDGRAVPAGIYFCHMKGKGFSTTRRMMLVK